MSPRLRDLLCATLALTCLTPSIAAAQYLDPGTGSIIVQLLAAGLVGVAAILKLYWHTIRTFFGSFLKRRPNIRSD